MSDVHINPIDYIDYYASTKGITVEEIGVAPIVVVSWSQQVIKSLPDKCGASRQDHWVKGGDNLYSGEMNGQQVSFANLPVGASATVMMMEELIACGANTFLGLGWAGSLRDDLPIGSLIIPTDCICEEGTSAHYHKPNTPIIADELLQAQLERSVEALELKVTSGTQWSTDAPYRELRSKAEEYRKRGALAVEMETSAMYALGKFREKPVCNLLVISDELGDVWRPAFHSPDLEIARQIAENVILECLRRITAS